MLRVILKQPAQQRACKDIMFEKSSSKNNSLCYLVYIANKKKFKCLLYLPTDTLAGNRWWPICCTGIPTHSNKCTGSLQEKTAGYWHLMVWGVWDWKWDLCLSKQLSTAIFN